MGSRFQGGVLMEQSVVRLTNWERKIREAKIGGQTETS